ncbi:Heterokaryon incompatibility protein (HET) domain containing protein [Naviculisporaceae sp. PSN 640]
MTLDRLASGFFPKMKVSELPFDKAIGLANRLPLPHEISRFSIFETGDTSKCLLDCSRWKKKHEIISQRRSNSLQKNEKQKEAKLHAKETIESHRQSLPTGERYSNSALRSRRNHFTLSELTNSVRNGCSSCKYYQALLGGLFLWLNECEHSHQRCGAGRSVPPPGRLLDLKAIPGKQDVRLLEIDTGETITYACLSHCWGKDPMPVRTTTQTMKDYSKEGISWEALPRTFQDAATITRRLGIRYLWIDSLCIIQDSVPDWEDQSGKMADIYRNSYITIAAASSADFRGGCFSTDLLGDLCFEITEEESPPAPGRTTPVAVRHCKGAAQLTETDHITQVYPLLTRAWVYQERILSRRVLYCNRSEPQFECRESVTCECGKRFIAPHPHPKTPAGNSTMRTIKKQYAEVMDRLGDSARLSRAQLSQHWNLVVMQYSVLSLTYPTDTLPALSGCAKDLAKRQAWSKEGYLKSANEEGLVRVS